MSAVPSSPPAEGLVSLARTAALDVRALVAEAGRRLRTRLVEDGRLSAPRLDTEQHAAHALAWLATYATAIGELAAYAERMTAEGRFGETESLLVRIGMGEYLDQAFSGIPMSQVETARLADLGVKNREAARYRTDAIETLIEEAMRIAAEYDGPSGAPAVGVS